MRACLCVPELGSTANAARKAGAKRPVSKQCCQVTDTEIEPDARWGTTQISVAQGCHARAQGQISVGPLLHVGFVRTRAHGTPTPMPIHYPHRALHRLRVGVNVVLVLVIVLVIVRARWYDRPTTKAHVATPGASSSLVSLASASPPTLTLLLADARLASVHGRPKAQTSSAPSRNR